MYEERVKIRRAVGDYYPVVIGTCEVCGRRRMYNTAIVGPPAKCYCTHRIMSVQKKEMLLIDKIQPIIDGMRYADPVLAARRGAKNLPYYASGIDPDVGERVFINLGQLPLGDDSPTYLYLIDFPDWRGEAFVKVGIGLAQRLRDHERHGGVVLQAIEIPRWQAYAIEQRILQEWPRFHPRTPLPQHGETECLLREVSGQLRLSRYVRIVADRKGRSATGDGAA